MVGYNLSADMNGNDPVIWDATNGWRVMRGLSHAFPKAINIHNVVIGGSWQGAFVWDEVNGPTFPFGSGMDPVAINDAGQVVGTDYSSYPYRAFIWDSTHGATYIPQLAGGYSQATDINNKGQVVGSAHIGGNWRGFIWDSAQGLTTLGSFGPYEDFDFGTYDSSTVTAINDLGQAIGTASSPGGFVGFVWDPVTGMRDLLGTTWLFPSAINNRGEVVGSNFSRGAFYAVVPPPPPPTPQGQALVIEDTIEALVTSGAIQQNDATVLTKVLDQAITSLDNGNTGAASNQLGAAVNKVNAMMNSGRISAAQGLALMDALNAVRASI